MSCGQLQAMFPDQKPNFEKIDRYDVMERGVRTVMLNSVDSVIADLTYTQRSFDGLQ
jgi:hypothetical protein